MELDRAPEENGPGPSSRDTSGWCQHYWTKQAAENLSRNLELYLSMPKPPPPTRWQVVKWRLMYWYFKVKTYFKNLLLALGGHDFEEDNDHYE